MLKHRVLLDEQVIATRVHQLAESIHGDLPGPDPILLGLLTGSFVFLADLARALGRRGIEPEIDFLAASHYGDGTRSSGRVRFYKDTALDIRQRAVLLVDDILDTGHTLQVVHQRLSGRHPSWLRSCVLLDKPSRRVVKFEADYVGFTIPDVWVIGCGLDAGGQGRALPYIGAIEPD